MSTTAEPRITPPPALGPPIIGPDTAGSAPGVQQPQIFGGTSLPPSFPLGTAGTWLPPPQVGFGENEPFPTLVVPPGPDFGIEQPQFAGGGSATVPPSLFPEFTTDGPQQPIVLTAIFKIGTVPPALPTTPGVAPIVMSQEWGQPPPPTPEPEPPPDSDPLDESGDNGEDETEPVHETLAQRVGLVPKPKAKPKARKRRG